MSNPNAILTCDPTTQSCPEDYGYSEPDDGIGVMESLVPLDASQLDVGPNEVQAQFIAASLSDDQLNDLYCDPVVGYCEAPAPFDPPSVQRVYASMLQSPRGAAAYTDNIRSAAVVAVDPSRVGIESADLLMSMPGDLYQDEMHQRGVEVIFVEEVDPVTEERRLVVNEYSQEGRVLASTVVEADESGVYVARTGTPPEDLIATAHVIDAPVEAQDEAIAEDERDLNEAIVTIPADCYEVLVGFNEPLTETAINVVSENSVLGRPTRGGRQSPQNLLGSPGEVGALHTEPSGNSAGEGTVQHGGTTATLVAGVAPRPQLITTLGGHLEAARAVQLGAALASTGSRQVRQRVDAPVAPTTSNDTGRVARHSPAVRARVDVGPDRPMTAGRHSPDSLMPGIADPSRRSQPLSRSVARAEELARRAADEAQGYRSTTILEPADYAAGNPLAAAANGATNTLPGSQREQGFFARENGGRLTTVQRQGSGANADTGQQQHGQTSAGAYAMALDSLDGANVAPPAENEIYLSDLARLFASQPQAIYA